MDFLACGEERKPWPAGTTLGDIVTSESYLRIWTFIATHGERHHFDKKLDDRLGKKLMHGRCIQQALSDASHAPPPGRAFGYVEGLCSRAFLSLHAWAVLQNSRHSLVVDRTWDLSGAPAEHIRYYGVMFDPDFFEWIWHHQRINDGVNESVTLPYLNTGACCMTYRPLLEGKVAAYPIKDGDREAAMSSLHDFTWAVHNIMEYRKEQKNGRSQADPE